MKNTNNIDLSEFVPVRGYEDRYLISPKGLVYSCSTDVLKKPTDIGNELTITLYDGKRYRTFTLIRLMALTFIPNPNNYPAAIPKDGDNYNTNIENIKWGMNSTKKQRLYRITTEDGKTFTMTISGIILYLGVNRSVFARALKANRPLTGNNGITVVKIEDIGMHKKDNRDTCFNVTMNDGSKKIFSSIIDLAQFLGIELQTMRHIIAFDTPLGSIGNKDIFSIEASDRLYINEKMEQRLGYIVKDIDGNVHNLATLPDICEKFGLDFTTNNLYQIVVTRGTRKKPIVGTKGTIVSVRCTRSLSKKSHTWTAVGYEAV